MWNQAYFNLCGGEQEGRNATSFLAWSISSHACVKALNGREPWILLDVQIVSIAQLESEPDLHYYIKYTASFEFIIL